MLPQQAEGMLKDYKACIGRCTYLEAVIAEMRELERAMIAEDRLSLMSVSGQQMDGMPHGTTVGNPTERAGIALASGYVSSDVTELRKEIAKLENEISEKRKTVVFVEAWLSGLTERERLMIEKFYFDGMTYKEINAVFMEKYGGASSKFSLRRIRTSALEKIFEMAK